MKLFRSQSAETDMTVGTPWKLILAFFIPLFLGNCFQQVYNLVDTIIVGKGISDNALAAVGSTGSLHFFVFGFVIGLTNGVAIPIAQAYGAKDEARLKKVVAMGLITCMSIGIFFSFLSIIGSSLMLSLLQTPKDIFSDAKAYMIIIFGALFVTVAYNFCSCLLRAIGDSRTPLIAIVISSLVNVILDLIFVILFRWGVRGAAWATVIAQVISVLFCVIHLMKVKIVHPGIKDWLLDFKMIGILIKLGIPVGFMNSITAFGGMVLQYFVNGMGSAYTAAYAACMKLFSFFEQPGMAIGIAMSTFVGQNYGAGLHKRIRTGVYSALVMTMILSSLLGALEFFFPDALVGIMLSEKASIDISRMLLPFGGLCEPFLGCLFVFRYTLIAIGITVIPMFSGFLELAMRVVLCLILALPLGFPGIVISELSAWIAACLMLGIYYFHYMKKLKSQEKDAKPSL